MYGIKWLLARDNLSFDPVGMVPQITDMIFVNSRNMATFGKLRKYHKV